LEAGGDGVVDVVRCPPNFVVDPRGSCMLGRRFPPDLTSALNFLSTLSRTRRACAASAAIDDCVDVLTTPPLTDEFG